MLNSLYLKFRDSDLEFIITGEKSNKTLKPILLQLVRAMAKTLSSYFFGRLPDEILGCQAGLFLAV